MNTAEKIKYYREAAGLTQKEVADKLGVNPQAVWKYEKGIVTNIPIRNLEIMAEMFGITPDKLTNWEKDDAAPATEDDLEMLHKNPDLRILLSASKDLRKSDIDFLVTMARRMNGEE